MMTQKVNDIEYRAVYQEIIGNNVTAISFNQAIDWLECNRDYYKYIPVDFFYPPIEGDKSLFRMLYTKLLEITEALKYNNECTLALSEYRKINEEDKESYDRWSIKYHSLTDKLFLFGISDYATEVKLFNSKEYGLVFYEFELYLSREELKPTLDFCTICNLEMCKD